MTDRDRAIDASVVDSLRRAEGQQTTPPKVVSIAGKPAPKRAESDIEVCDGFIIGAEGNVYPFDVQRRCDDDESRSVGAVGIVFFGFAAVLIAAAIYFVLT